MNIVIFGPPGAGKGTQSNLLIERYNLVHLSTGDILREEIAVATALGLEAKSLIYRGDIRKQNQDACGTGLKNIWQFKIARIVKVPA